MKIKMMSTLALTAMAVLATSAVPAEARPHHPKKVCKVWRNHGHVKRVCHWVR